MNSENSTCTINTLPHKIFACGTICTTRIGCVLSVRNLSQSWNLWGQSKLYFNSNDGILFGKWNDNKVVSFLCTLSLVRIESTTQQCMHGKNILPMPQSTECA